MSKKKFGSGMRGKGYYIALVLCAVAVGVAGFLYYRNAANRQNALQDPAANAGQMQVDPNDDVEAVAPQPQGGGQSAEQPHTGDGKKPPVVKEPLAGETISPYSMDMLTYNQTTRDWRVHDGVDISAAAGTTVSAAAAGTVYTVYEDEEMGMTVVIRHDGGYTTKYASLAETVSVKAGDKVTAGQAIGTVGNTALMESAVGDHLHFSVSCNGELVDPAKFLS